MSYCERCGEDGEGEHRCDKCNQGMCSDCMTERELMSGECRNCSPYYDPRKDASMIPPRVVLPVTQPTPSEAVKARLAIEVADTLLARRNAERDVAVAKHVSFMAQDSPEWHALMRRERDARVANDSALAKYRALFGTAH